MAPEGFKCYWRWKSKSSQVGRPKIDHVIRALIRRMSRENPTWGVPRLQAELQLLGHKVAESTIAKYRVRNRKPPSQTWKTFLQNHAGEIAANLPAPPADHRIPYATDPSQFGDLRPSLCRLLRCSRVMTGKLYIEISVKIVAVQT